MELQKLVDVLKTIGISIPVDDEKFSELEKFVKFESFNMGDPLLLANQIPTDILILLEGQIRQLINNPVNGEIMTLGLQKPPYVIGFKSCKAAFPLEFVTAADECKFARIKYKDWINLITLYSDNNSIQSKVFPDEILPFLIHCTISEIVELNL